MMLKIPPKHHPVYIAAISILYVGLIVCILVLAAISNDTGFWIAAIFIDLFIIVLGIRLFYKFFKPRLVPPPIRKILDFGGQTTSSIKKRKTVEKDE